MGITMMTKREWLRKTGFEARLQRDTKTGTNLTEGHIGHIREAAWQAYREGQGKRARAMPPSARAMKAHLLRHLRAGLGNFRVLSLLPLNGWFREKDIRKVLDKEAVVGIVRLCVSTFGREYADEIVKALGEAHYAGEGEAIQIVRNVYPVSKYL